MIEALTSQVERISAVQPRASRLRTAGELVARMRPRFTEFGITRLAETTGLDRVGWPVWAAVRPNAPTLSVSQGKGASREAAQASAVMEAVEMSVAEGIRATWIASAAALAARGEAFDLLPGLLRRGCAVPRPEHVIGWVRGHDLTRSTTVWVPAQAIRIDATEPDRIYWQSSDGLGSGNLLVEAVLHGLCEAIERDAGEFWLLRSDDAVAEACIDPHSLDVADLSALADRVARAGLHLRLFDITGDIDVPNCFATVSPPPGGREGAWLHFDLASGMGCRPDLADAAIAAIGEALQSRLTTISGARDDFQPDLYRQPVAPDILIYPRCRPRPANPGAASGIVAIRDALGWLLRRLDAAEIGSVIVVPLLEDDDLAVAKVIVPRLEHPPGARAVPHGDRLGRAMGGA